MNRKNARPELRFWAKVDKRGSDDCWPWLAAARRKDEGYGAFYFQGRQHPAHRMALLFTGVETPAGMVVCHRCDNPGCCNPAHLFIGRSQDNDADRVAKKRQAYGERNANAKLTDLQVWKIRKMRHVLGMTYEKIGRYFGVKNLWHACAGRTWRHVDMEAQRQQFLRNQPVGEAMMILQSAPGWLNARVGCATASHANDILDIRKDGKPGAKYIQYLADLVTERATGRAIDRPVTKWMTRGSELESLARDAYEEETGILVGPAAFVSHPSIEFAGATPDGFIDPDGLLEIKVPAPSTFVKWRMAGGIPSDHAGQMTFQLVVTRRKWVEFCAWCPDVDPRLQLFVRRFTPDAAEIDALEQKIKEFLLHVDQAFEAYTLTAPEVTT